MLAEKNLTRYSKPFENDNGEELEQMDLQAIDPVTVLLAAGAALALVIIITLGVKIAGCIFTLTLIFLPAAIAGGACAYFYNEQAGFAAAIIVALMMLLLVRRKPE